MKITEQMLKDIHDEMIRRLQDTVHDAGIKSERVILEMWADMLQGSYATLMTIATNWSDTVAMMDRIGFDELNWR